MGFVMDYLKHRAEIKEEGLSAAIYYRRKYNTAILELEVCKEVMASDVYKKTLKLLNDPLELKQAKRTIERQRRIIEYTRMERDELLKLKEKRTNGKKKESNKQGATARRTSRSNKKANGSRK